MQSRAGLALLLFSIALFLTCTQSPLQGENDHDGPTITIISSVPEKSVSTEITVKGKITDESSVDSVILNNNGTKHGIVMQGDSFSIDVSLAYGVNVIGIFAMDNSANHNVSSDTFFITRETEARTQGLILTISEPQAGNIQNALWMSDTVSIKPIAIISMNLNVDNLFLKYKIAELKIMKIPAKVVSSLDSASALFSSSSYSKYIKISLSNSSAHTFSIIDTVPINTDYYYAVKCIFIDTSINQTIEQYIGPFHYRFYSRNLSTVNIDSTADTISFSFPSSTNQYSTYYFLTTNYTTITDSFFLKAIPSIIYHGGTNLGLASPTSNYLRSMQADSGKLKKGFYSKYGIDAPQLFNSSHWVRDTSKIPFSYGRYYKLYVVSVNYFGDMSIDSVSIKGPSKITDYKMLFGKDGTSATLKKEFNPHDIYLVDSTNTTGRSLAFEQGTEILSLKVIDSLLNISSSTPNSNDSKSLIVFSQSTYNEVKNIDISDCKLTGIRNNDGSLYLATLRSTASRFKNCLFINPEGDTNNFELIIDSLLSVDFQSCTFTKASMGFRGFQNAKLDDSYCGFVNCNIDNSIVTSAAKVGILSSNIAYCMVLGKGIYLYNCKTLHSHISNSSATYNVGIEKLENNGNWEPPYSEADFTKSSDFIESDIYSIMVDFAKSSIENSRIVLTLPVLNSTNTFYDGVVNLSKCSIVLSGDFITNSFIEDNIRTSSIKGLSISNCLLLSTWQGLYRQSFVGNVSKLLFDISSSTISIRSPLFEGYSNGGELILDKTTIIGCSSLLKSTYSTVLPNFDSTRINNSTFYGMDSLSIAFTTPSLKMNHNTFYPNKYFNISGTIDTLVSTNNIFNASGFTGTFKSLTVSNCNFPTQPTFPTTNCIIGDPMVDIRDDGVFLKTGSPCIAKASDGRNIGAN